MTRSGGKAGPVPDNGTVDGAPGRRRTLSPEGSRVAPDARRVRTTPAKRVSPALSGAVPALHSPSGGRKKGKPAYPAPIKE